MLADRWVVGGLVSNTADRKFRATKRIELPANWSAPDAMDNRADCTPTEDQGQVPCCVACAITTLIESERWRVTHVREQLDYMNLYKKCKDIDADGQDGTSFSTGFKAAVELGMIGKESRYHDLRTLDDVRYALHRFHLVAGGFEVTEGWSRTGDDGWVQADDGALLGGHAVVLCAMNLIPACVQWVGFKNSWGGFGAKGFGRLSKQHFERFFLGGCAIESA